MSESFDVAVVGLGVTGSAAARMLARKGLSVLGLDRYTTPHALGSSHGGTRIIREAYFEHPLYVPLVRRAYELWADLERTAGGRTVYHKTGGLMIGAPDSTLVKGAEASAVQHRIPHEILSAGKIHRRFPVFSPLDEWVGVLENRAGYLDVELGITLMQEQARLRGASLRFEEPVIAWKARAGGGVTVATSKGQYEVGKLVLAAGPWMNELLGGTELPLTIERQVTFWFEPSRAEEQFAPDRMPVSIWEIRPGSFFYTVPDVGHGVKVAWHHGGVAVPSPESVDRTVSPDELAKMFDLLRRFVPFAKGRVMESAICLYTNTPDEHFVIDWHPDSKDVVVASACSGHGFKFAPVVGEIVADLVTTGGTDFDLGAFSLTRLLDR